MPFPARVRRQYPFASSLIVALATLLSMTCAERSGLGVSPVTGDISGTEQGTYVVGLERDQALRIVVDQRAADLVLDVSGDGSTRSVDMREFGHESVTLIARTRTRFAVAIRARRPTPRRLIYALWFDEPPHPITTRDRQWQEAERLETKGKELATGADASPQAAIESLKAALIRWRALGDDLGQATVLARLGDIDYAHGEFAKTEGPYVSALLLARKHGLIHLTAQVTNNLGVGRGQRGLLRDARLGLLQALLLWSLLSGVEINTAATLNNLGAVLLESGDYQEALERFQSAQWIFARFDDPAEAGVLTNLGSTHRGLGDLDAAQRYLDQATEFPSPQAPAPLRPSALQPRIRALVRRARIALERGDPDTADARARAVLALIGDTDPVTRADALDVRGQVAASRHAYAAALPFYEQALAQYLKAEALRGVATVRQHAGVAHRLLRQHPTARAELREALDIRTRLGLRDAEAETLYELGVLEREDGQLSEAHGYLVAAVQMIEDVRGRVAGDYSRVSYFAARHQYFSAYIDLLMEVDSKKAPECHAAEPFRIAEQERSRALLDSLSDVHTDIGRDANPALYDQAEEAQRQLNFFSRQLAIIADRKDNKKALTEVQTRVDAILHEFRELRGRLAATREGETIEPKILGVVEVQNQILDDGSALIRFSLGDRRSFAWLITKGAFTCAELPGRSDIDAVATEVRNHFGTPRTLENRSAVLARFNDAARRLSTMLLQKFAADLGTRRLIIVAEGSLQYVPFAALPEPGSDLPLIARHEIVTGPSASAIAVLRQRAEHRERAPKQIAVFADAVYDRRDPRRGKPAGDNAAGDNANVVELPPLRQSRALARKILGRFTVEQQFEALGFDANADAAIDPSLGDFRILHFDVHGAVDPQRPELSTLYFAQFFERGPVRDGSLALHTIASRLHLRADLVVLSACETAVGRDVPGEGLVALAGAFFAAGASTVVGTLIPVREAPTVELMDEFYKRLLSLETPSPAAALRAAQNAMRARPELADPFYWAGFVVMGDASRPY